MKISESNKIRLGLLLVSFVALTGCQEPSGAGSGVVTGSGAYQIVDDTKNDGVFIADTSTGRVEQCQWLTSSEEWACFVVRKESGVNPAGRFQMVNDSKADGVFIADTVSGRVEQCQWNRSKEAWSCYTVRGGSESVAK